MNLIVKKFIAFSLLFSLTFLAWTQPNQNEQLGIQYYQNGEYEKAKEMFKSVYEKKSDSYIYYYYYRTLLELRDFKELEKLVKNQQKLYPKIQRYVVELGYVYETAGDVQKATKEYENAIKNVPAQRNAYIELYNAFLSIAKRDYAIETLLRGRKALNEPKSFSKELTQQYIHLNLTDKVIAEAFSILKQSTEIPRLSNSSASRSVTYPVNPVPVKKYMPVFFISPTEIYPPILIIYYFFFFLIRTM